MVRYSPLNGDWDSAPALSEFKLDLELELKAAFPKLKVVEGIPSDTHCLDPNQREDTKFSAFALTYNPRVEHPNLRTGDFAKHIHLEFQDLDDKECRLIYRVEPTNIGEGGQVPEGHSMYRKAIYTRLVIVSEEVYQQYLSSKSEVEDEKE